MNRWTNIVAALMLLFIGIGIGLVMKDAPSSALAQSGCRTFPETSKQVCGRFLQYWQQNGGVAQQGLPLSNEFQEVSDLNGKTYTVQYFERAVFEKHPENAVPYDVLLSQLGTFQFKRKYPGGESGGQPQTPEPQPGGIIGQVFTYTPFAAKTTFKLVVTDVKEPSTIPKSDFIEEQKAQGKYVAVLANISNFGTEPGTFFSGDFRLKDNKGRSFDSSSNISALINAANYYNAKGSGTALQPGFADTFVLLFDIPTDATGYTLVRH